MMGEMEWSDENRRGLEKNINKNGFCGFVRKLFHYIPHDYISVSESLKWESLTEKKEKTFQTFSRIIAKKPK